jgi:hypothetical protein
MKRGFRGQAIYLVQSPPILMSHCVGRVPRLKASDVGDLGGISRLKRSDEDLCIHGSPQERELEMSESPSPWGEGLR